MLPPATPIEIELKLEVRDPRAARGLLSGASLGELRAAGPARTVLVVDRYLDTPDGLLQRAGRVVRLRQVDDRVLVTVKSVATPVGSAVHRREELEAPAADSLAPRSWPASDARSLVLELAGDASLEEVVTLRQARRTRSFGIPGTTIEVSLDRVVIVHDGRRVGRFVELEAELVEGDVERLQALGDRLLLDPALTPARWSKLERARAAIERARRDAERPRIVVGKSPGVLATDRMAEAGRKVMAVQFERLLAREAATREGADPEALHQMRVATRRLRAAWRTFGEAFEPRATRRLRRPLRTIGLRLGAVRDLDVLLADILDHRATMAEGERADLAPLIAWLEARREVARVQLVRALDAPGYGRWCTASVAFLTTPGAGVPPATAGEASHVRELAPARIWTAYGHVRAYEPIVPWADVPTLHALRTEGKRLRYAIEFLREPLGPGMEPLVARVVTLQDHLGALHDADVAATVGRDFLAANAGSITPGQRSAIGTYVRRRDADLRRLRRTVGGPWRGVMGLTFRRRLGRVLAEL